MNKKVIGTICGVVIVSSVLSISKCDYFNNKHKEINIITTTSVKIITLLFLIVVLAI